MWRVGVSVIFQWCFVILCVSAVTACEGGVWEDDGNVEAGRMRQAQLESLLPQGAGVASGVPLHALGPHLHERAPDAPTKEVGEGCDRYGASECRSGVCLHVKPLMGRGYVCSRACGSKAPCPMGWRCVQAVPGGEEGLRCAPPDEWTPRIAPGAGMPEAVSR
jgi:hypothetical protein